MIGEFTKAQGGEQGLVRKSMLVFAGFYVAATAGFMAVQAIFDFDLKMVDEIVSMMFAGTMAGSSMVKRVGRAPEKEELFKLKLGCLLVVLVLQVVLAVVVIQLLAMAGNNALMDMIASMPLLLALGVALLMIGLHYLLIASGIRSGVKAAVKQLPTEDKVAETFS